MKSMKKLFNRPGIDPLPTTPPNSSDIQSRKESIHIAHRLIITMNRSLSASTLLPEKYGLLIIAIKKHGDSLYTYNPSSAAQIEHSDVVVVLGYKDQIVEFRKEAAAV